MTHPPERDWDLIVVGSGPGGASLAQRLAPSGLRILILERGDWLRRETQNWSAKSVFVDGRYQVDETWHDGKGGSFRPGLHRFVGGNSKVYGAALFRLRERDFDTVVHADGVSPAWPLGYDAFEPYYAEAERLFFVHGRRGEDPTEPPSSSAYPHPPVAHEPRIAAIDRNLRDAGLHPFHLPLGLKLEQDADGRPTKASPCIRCDAFDGFPCAVDAKADAQVACIDPMLAAHPNVTLLTGALVTRLETDTAGRRVSEVVVKRGGVEERYTANVVVVAGGALSSALLLLGSASRNHPDGLANGSGLVGRHYMRHNQSVLMALSREANDAVFQKTLAVSDWYFGADDWEFPLGLVQMMAKSHPDQIRSEALPAWLDWLPAPFETMAHHAVDFWLSSEDLPRPENRVRFDADGKVVLELEPNNMEAHRRLRAKLESVLERCGLHQRLLDRSLYFGKDIAIGGTAHQAGTARFGRDPASSVLDLDCKAHEIDNLYLADASFFPSIGAVNPTLTIVANALRVADRIAERLGVSTRSSSAAHSA